MGLSKKLGGAVSGARAEMTLGPVQYTWSTQAYTMQDILRKFSLPCVVQCAGDAGSVLWADFRFDMRQPLLLHAARTVRKLHARSLQVLEPSGMLEEFGPPLAIPEDYDGWFYPVPRHTDPTDLPRHTRVEMAAGSSSRRVLVTTSLPAFTPARTATPAGTSRHVQHEVTPGEVLTKVGVMKGDPSVPSSSPTALMRQINRQSLRCLDENEHEILVPFHHLAKLYDVADNYGPPSSSTSAPGTIPPPQPSSPGVVHTRTVITVGNRLLPRVFRHVHGDLPALAQTFTGLLRCYSVFTEETVMAATMGMGNGTGLFSSVTCEEPSCLELATDSSAKFRIALNANELRKSSLYALALRICEEEAPSYVRAIKTSFTVTPVLRAGDGDAPYYHDGGADDDGGSGIQHSERNKRTPAVAKSEDGFLSSETKGPPYGDGSTAEAFECAQTSFVNAAVGQKGHSSSSGGVAVLEREQGGARVIHGDDNDDAGGDDESVMTDDVPSSVLDSDATDMQCSDGVSDVGDVEANSEFDITWGRLKRARSFTGSLSTLTDSSAGSSSPTESDDSQSEVEGEEEESLSVRGGGGGPVDSSQNSTLTRDATTSSGTSSGSTVVLRTSAPSPVYANVSKPLSVFSDGQTGAGATQAQVQAQGGHAGVADAVRVDRSSGHYQNVGILREREEEDHSVRSVWNSTPTPEAQHDSALMTLPCTEGGDGEAVTNPIWWGDGTRDQSPNDSSAWSTLDSKQRVSASSEHTDSFALDSLPGTRDKVTRQGQHVSVSQRSSTGSTTGVEPGLAPRPLLSSRLSVKSEGSAQDLVIQRLEMALNDATSFLSAHGPHAEQCVENDQPAPSDQSTSSDQLALPPRRGMTTLSSAQPGGLQGPTHYGSAGLPRVGEEGDLSVVSPVSNEHTLHPQDLEVPAEKTHQDLSGNRRTVRETYQSDTQLDCVQVPPTTTNNMPTHHNSDGQIDLDFVKTLGDRLMAVSKKTSLPKYQRLQPETDTTGHEHNDSQDGCHQYRKKPRAADGFVSAQDGAVGRVGVGVGAMVDPHNAPYTEDRDSRHRQAILTDLDFLEEEVV